MIRAWTTAAVRAATVLPTRGVAPLATIAPQKWKREVVDWSPPAVPSTPLEAWVTDFNSGERRGITQLNRFVFGLPLRVDILQRVVRWQLSKRFLGNHSAKDRSEVSGTTRKLYPQKHMGRARAGSMRAPQFRHGGIVFPPKPRSHAIDLPRKVRSLGLRIALSTKFASDDLVIVEEAQLADHKTRLLNQVIRDNGWKDESVLLVTGETVPENIKRACRNLHKFDVLPAHALNVYDILRHDKLVLTRSALEFHEGRYRHRRGKRSTLQSIPPEDRMPFHPLYPQQVL